MKIKNCLIGLLIAIVSIIPISNVKADVIYGGETFPNIVEDGYESFMIIKNSSGTSNFGYGTWLIKFDKNNIGYLNIENTGASSYPLRLRLDNTPTSGDYSSISYKAYKLENNTWNLTYDRNNNTTSANKKITGFEKVYYSTENIYFYKYSSTNSLTLYYDDSGLVCRKSSDCTNLINTVTYKTSSSDTGYENVLYEPFINEYISYDYDIKESSDGNYSFYDIRIFTENYNDEYNYLIKFDDEPFIDITNYMSDSEGISYEVPHNTTLELWVRDSFLETVELKSVVFDELIDIEEYEKPSIDLSVSCSTEYETNLERALVNFDFNNYSTSYKYSYSFNDIDYIEIPYSDIKNKKYLLTTYINTSIFVKIEDNNENIKFKDYIDVNCILDNEQYYYYEFTIDDLYNKEENKLIFYTFYYENVKRDIIPFVYFFYTGSEKLDFHITYNTSAIDLPTYNESLMTKTLNDLPCTTLPFEYIDKTIFTNNYTSYTVFSFMPCIDLSTFLYDEQYKDFKLIVKSNLRLKIGEPISFGGNFIPSTNKPIDESNTFQSNFTSFFDKFNSAFNRFKDVILEIFQNCTYFFNNLDLILQDFYIVVFVIILFIFLIRFVL